MPEELLSTIRRKMLLQRSQGQNMFKISLAHANKEKVLTFSKQCQNGAFHVRAKQWRLDSKWQERQPELKVTSGHRRRRKIALYVDLMIILYAFWLIFTYNLLEDSRIDEVTITKFWLFSYYYAIDHTFFRSSS